MRPNLGALPSKKLSSKDLKAIDDRFKTVENIYDINIPRSPQPQTIIHNIAESIDPSASTEFITSTVPITSPLNSSVDKHDTNILSID